MSGVRAIGERYVVEIDNHDKRGGLLCAEGFEVRVCDEGGGLFLAIKGRNLEPTEDYDSHTVSLERDDIPRLATVLTEILDQAEQAAE